MLCDSRHASATLTAVRTTIPSAQSEARSNLFRITCPESIEDNRTEDCAHRQSARVRKTSQERAKPELGYGDETTATMEQ